MTSHCDGQAPSRFKVETHLTVVFLWSILNACWCCSLLEVMEVLEVSVPTPKRSRANAGFHVVLHTPAGAQENVYIGGRAISGRDLQKEV